MPRRCPTGSLVHAGPGKLPKMIGARDEKPGPAFYESLLRSPFGDELTLDFARAAIVGEELGQDDSPTSWRSAFRATTTSTTPRAPSRACRTTICCSSTACCRSSSGTSTDGRQGQLRRGADGRPRLHAGARAQPGARPRRRADQRERDAGADQRGLETRFGDAKAGAVPVGLGAGARQEAHRRRKAWRSTRSPRTRASSCSPSRASPRPTRAPRSTAAAAPARRSSTQMRKTWNAERSGDVQMVLKPNWMFGSSRRRTHGSPYPYDTQVPILFYGPRGRTPGGSTSGSRSPTSRRRCAPARRAGAGSLRRKAAAARRR